MTQPSLSRVTELLGAALELPVEERQAWLEQTCGEDAALLREVRELLREERQAGAYFDSLASDVARSSSRELSLAAAHGLEIGPYRILREIGRGGMGVVYLAERADGQFDRRVALKLIPRGMESEAAIDRFLAERQILARLEHAHIARLLDGGVSDDGRPYLVMEYVDGVPLHRYCDENRLDVDQRLQLVLAVGEAVQYAHGNLVIHRDLKPSNILVTAAGEVKLVDFGIAKLLSDDPDATFLLTRTSQRALTPEYAAPEQILGQPITTATDVYALGVILYELLAGRRPYRFRGRTAGEIERLISDTSPPLPSTAVGTAVVAQGAEPTAEEIATARSTRSERLRRRLRGDLDRIVLMALRREPERRYRSAERLVEDLRRHIAGLPVAARADTFAYRSVKYVQRNALGVAVAVGGLLLVVGFAVAMALQSLRLARERDRAEQVSQLLVEIFELADPSEARGQTITAREILDRGTERIGVRLSRQPLVKADLMDLMGQVYQNLGLYDDALPLLEESLELRQRALSPGDAEVARSLDHLGELLRLKGDYDRAEPLLRQALAFHRATDRADRSTVAETLDTLAKLLFAQGRFDESEPLFRRALATLRGSDSEGKGAELAAVLNDLGALLFAQGRFDEARPMFDEALALRRKRLGEDHPLVAASLNNLASLEARTGDDRAAERLYEEALILYRGLLGDEHPRVATTLNNLALVRYSSGDLAAAEPLFRQSLALRRSLLDRDHPDIAQSLSNLGLLLRDKGELEEAEQVLREALDIQRMVLGDRHPAVVASSNNLALVLQTKGEYDAAEVLLREGLATLQQLLGEGHPQVATNLNNLASLLHARGELDAAESLYRRTLELRRRLLSADHPHTAHVLVGLGRLLRERGDVAEASDLAREALDIRRRALPATHADVREAEQLLSTTLAERAPPR